MRKLCIPALLGLASACASPPPAEAPAPPVATAPVATPAQETPRALPAADGAFAVFAPKEETSSLTIDYSVWNDMLRAMVFNMGPSTRRRASYPDAPTGTRFVRGHDSPLRLEGNRVYFSGLDDEIVAALTEYKNDLVSVGNRYDIAALNRNEQLSYWLNLYNVLTIEQIAANYPVKFPSEMKVGPDKVLFDDAKLVVIKGVPLSLKDIRTQIVYQNWRSPKVIYGFFRGDIGGPSIRNQAYNRFTVNNSLSNNAAEFINSLRGAADVNGVLKVSRIYEEARPYFFSNWPRALTAHIAAYMKDETAEDLNLAAPVEFQKYETRVADLAGGEPHTSLAGSQVLNATGQSSVNSVRLPSHVARLIIEVEQKLETLRARGEARGRVIITDLDSPDEGDTSGEVR